MLLIAIPMQLHKKLQPYVTLDIPFTIKEVSTGSEIHVKRYEKMSKKISSRPVPVVDQEKG
jgi:hypothetical protein